MQLAEQYLQLHAYHAETKTYKTMHCKTQSRSIQLIAINYIPYTWKFLQYINFTDFAVSENLIRENLSPGII